MKKYLLLLALTMLAAPVGADVDAATEANIRESLSGLLAPGRTLDEIRKSPVDGLYEVTLGSRVIYVTGDGRHVITGKLIDAKTRIDLTETRLAELQMAASAERGEMLAELGEETMVIYGPEDARHTVTVFTDIDCGYCRKMHSEMADYAEQGIRVRYLFYPRAGVGSRSYDTSVSVWCADDRKAAMDAAKAGIPIEPRKCENPVAAHYTLGQDMEVTGTPAVITTNGQIIGGYVPAGQLRKALDDAGLAAN